VSSSIDELQPLLAKALEIPEPFKRRLYVLGVITHAFAEESASLLPILVGGGAVEFYSLGGYATYDIDVVVGNRDKFGAVLTELGFSKCPGERHWYHEGLNIAIEAPDSVLAGSMERVATVDVEGLLVHIIGIEDLIMDRIRACVYWRSTADCEWASRMMAMHEDSMDWDYLEKQAKDERLSDTLLSLRHDDHRHR
jgi:hypothetical protein